MRATRRSRKGVAAVEFALVLPLLILLVMGAWEVGRLVQVMQLLDNAAREGGRQAATGKKTNDEVKTAVVECLNQNGITAVTTSDVTVTNVTSGKDATSADQLDQFEVKVSISFN